MGCEGVKVFILAGGLGTRIRPMFSDLPKAMIPFNGKPFLEIQMGMLATQGFTSFVLCVGHQADQISAHFGDGEAWGCEIAYSLEPHPLGTGGALQYAKRHLDATSIVLNGDTYLPMDYQALVKTHASFDSSIGTVTVVEMEDTRRYGQVVVDKQSRIQVFREKTESSGPGLVNAGVYVFEPQILQHIPAEGSISLERDVFPSLLTSGIPLHAFTSQQAFFDIGTPEGYRTLQNALE
jgi:NDP-sugar pyrophosphorylase family protein